MLKFKLYNFKWLANKSYEINLVPTRSIYNSDLQNPIAASRFLKQICSFNWTLPVLDASRTEPTVSSVTQLNILGTRLQVITINGQLLSENLDWDQYF